MGNFAKIRALEDAKRLNDETVKAGIGWKIVDKQTGQLISWAACQKIGAADLAKKVYFYGWVRNEYKQLDLGREILEKVLHFAFFGIKTAVVFTGTRSYGKLAYPLI